MWRGEILNLGFIHRTVRLRIHFGTRRKEKKIFVFSVTTVHRFVLVLICGLLSVIVSGCASIGPDSVQRDRIDYVEAISNSSKDQLLLNIVRLRYDDTPVFIDVSSVVSGYAIGGQVQAGFTGNS